jgi:hypothetical protein
MFRAPDVMQTEMVIFVFAVSRHAVAQTLCFTWQGAQRPSVLKFIAYCEFIAKRIKEIELQ